MEIGDKAEGFCILCGVTFIGLYPQDCPECGSDCVDYLDDYPELPEDEVLGEWWD